MPEQMVRDKINNALDVAKTDQNMRANLPAPPPSDVGVATVSVDCLRHTGIIELFSYYQNFNCLDTDGHTWTNVPCSLWRFSNGTVLNDQLLSSFMETLKIEGNVKRAVSIIIVDSHSLLQFAVPSNSVIRSHIRSGQ